MSQIEHYYTKFDEYCFYHVYNRTVDKQPMFKSEDNYRFFLTQYDHYVSPVADTYAFSLLGNHFHLLIRIKGKDEFLLGDNKSFEEKSVPHIVSHQFKKFFQSYSMAFNKQHNRIGTLFQTPFKRALITSDIYFTQLIIYIHTNPQLHGLTDDFKNWPWSSYKRLLGENQSKLKRKEVMEWFDSKENYELSHKSTYAHKLDLIVLEDD